MLDYNPFFPNNSQKWRSATRVVGENHYKEPKDYWAMRGLDDASNGWVTPIELAQTMALAARQSTQSGLVATWWATNFSTSAKGYTEMSAAELQYIRKNWPNENRLSWTPEMFLTKIQADSFLKNRFLAGYYTALSLAGGKNTADGQTVVNYYRQKYAAGIRDGATSWKGDLVEVFTNPGDVASEVFSVGAETVAQVGLTVGKTAGTVLNTAGTIVNMLPWIIGGVVVIGGVIAFKNRDKIAAYAGKRIDRVTGG